MKRIFLWEHIFPRSKDLKEDCGKDPKKDRNENKAKDQPEHLLLVE
jgi:hypothetical protein